MWIILKSYNTYVLWYTSNFPLYLLIWPNLLPLPDIIIALVSNEKLLISLGFSEQVKNGYLPPETSLFAFNFPVDILHISLSSNLIYPYA